MRSRAAATALDATATPSALPQALLAPPVTPPDPPELRLVPGAVSPGYTDGPDHPDSDAASPRRRPDRPGGDRPARRYVPALDGIRALAVAAVVAYHLGFGWAGGGYFGVDIFFVLSGYLITDGLLTAWTTRRFVDLRRFWVARARRLLPALVVMVVVVAAAATVFARDTLGALRGDTLAAATYTSNWWQISRSHSYFAATGSVSALQHLWSLAVEEQFYLVWPILLAVALRWLPRRLIVPLTLLGALGSALAMGLLYQPHADPTRVYVGTDTHSTAVLVGAALAFGWPLAAPATGLTAAGRRLVQLLGLAGLVGLGAAVYELRVQGAFVFRGGFTLVALAALVLIAAAVVPGSVLGRALGTAPLRWIGARSYGIYLWHYPVIALSRSAAGGSALTLPARLGEAALAVGLAAASYRFIEVPIKRSGIGATLRAAAARVRECWTDRRPGNVAAVAGVGSVLVVALVGFGIAPGSGQASKGVQAQVEAGRRIAEQSRRQVEHPAVAPTSTPTGTPPAAASAPPSATKSAATSAAVPGGAPVGNPPTGSAPTGTTPPLPAGSDVVGIGDSVMLAAAAELHTALPGMVIDAEVSRQMYSVPDLIAIHRADDTLRPVVVLAIGTNGPFTTGQLTAVLTAIGPGHTVVLVNTYAARDWESGVNATLAAAAKRPGVTLVDWHDAIGKHTGELWGDHIHPQPVGAERYVELLRRALPAADQAAPATTSSGPSAGPRPSAGHAQSTSPANKPK